MLAARAAEIESGIIETKEQQRGKIPYSYANFLQMFVFEWKEKKTKKPQKKATTERLKKLNQYFSCQSLREILNLEFESHQVGVLISTSDFSFKP